MDLFIRKDVGAFFRMFFAVTTEICLSWALRLIVLVLVFLKSQVLCQ